MKLRDLEAQLLKCIKEISTEVDENGKYVFRDTDGEIRMWSGTPDSWIFAPVDTVAEANGIRFLCPKSYAKNGGTKGTHSVYVFFQGSPHAGRNLKGEEVRWNVVGGSTIDDLQLTPSILEEDGADTPAEWRCGWHGFVGSNNVPAGEAA